MTEKYFLSWDEIHRDSAALAQKLHDLGRVKGIIAVARGGLIPATLLAQELNIRNVEAVSVKSYNHDQRGEVSSSSSYESFGSGEGWLVVDDLVDSGNTFLFLKEKLPKATFACLYAKPAGEGKTDFFVRSFAQNQWLVFPWERNPDGLAYEG